MHDPTPSASRSVGPTADATRPRAVALVGPGRAGRAVAGVLRRAGWPIVAVVGRSISAPSTQEAASDLDAPARGLDDAGSDADVVLIATPDDAIASVADAVVGSVVPGALVVHLAGSRGLDEFDRAMGRRPDVRFAALHPLLSIPTPDHRHITGGWSAAALTGGWCAVAGDPDVYDLAHALGLQPFVVAAGQRSQYHAIATVAANHLTALMGQVERLARGAGLPFEAFFPLVRGVLENVEALGAA